jgi:hypothetical protein
MLQKGAVGFLGATKVALGCHGWSDPMNGSSQSLDYYFTTCVTSEDYTQGEAHQWALRRMYTYGLWSYVKYEMFEWGALWGNPNLSMAYVVNRGDANDDGEINTADVVFLINYMFKGESAPDPMELGDANCDGEVNAADVVHLINYLYQGGPVPGC